ncbi:MAG: phosphoenolpyruvate carboxykinase [Candidatus Atribacteria bacterium]|nr:phosphoenolpyruvate carboxykinase [Candidatus Atribacteria bacterium]
MEPHYPLEKAGIRNLRSVFYNLSIPVLFEHAFLKKEGILTKPGAFNVLTGRYTGRSPKDRYIVDDAITHERINWGSVNVPIEAEKFYKLHERLTSYLQQRDVYVYDGYVGVDPQHRMAVRFINEYAYQNVFVQNMFLEATPEELAHFVPDFTVICAPRFQAKGKEDGINSEAFVILNFTEKMVIIGGTSYGGEIKKAIFTVLNFLLPQAGVLPMHCSANVGEKNDVALFFGLSGTGKTSLSADPTRRLIGDDEHGWSEQGVFNFEGGCYAKCINLSQEKEPQIWEAIRYGAIMENVVVDPDTRVPDYNDNRYTENTRVSYPIEFIPNALIPGIAGHPQVVMFLTADAFGVLPPVAKLTRKMAIYHFLLGYTSKLAGTERGIVEPQATFSTCFGAPFMPCHPRVYGEMLGEKIDRHGVKVYLVNTGWVGGPYGVGQRIDIGYTRSIVQSIVDGSIESVGYREDTLFELLVPKSVPGVPPELLDPRGQWQNPEEYDQKAKELIGRFEENMKKYQPLPE